MLLRPWDFPGKGTGVGSHFLPQRIFLTQGLNLGLLHCRQTLDHLSHQGSPFYWRLLLLLLLSHFHRVWLCATPSMAAHQAPSSLGFSRQEHWSGLLFSSPMRESEKWKWSHSVVSDSSWPHGLQPTRPLCPWDFPGKSTGVGCHHLLHVGDWPLLNINRQIRYQLTSGILEKIKIKIFPIILFWEEPVPNVPRILVFEL